MNSRSANQMIVTIFDGISNPKSICLEDFGKDVIYFGRNDTNDIVIESHLVSRDHGRFRSDNGQWIIEDKALYSDKPSNNGLIFNDYAVYSRTICEGDFIRIDDGIETISEGVLFVFATMGSSNKWEVLDLYNRNEIRIGRDKKCDIVLPHISVSKCHARIVREGDSYYLIDNASSNGVIINDRRLSGKHRLHEKDIITITNSKLVFTSGAIYYCCYKNGISVDISNIVITRGKGRKSAVTSNDVNLDVKPGELVAIIGGSGAGKSTILNCMCGYLKPTKGDVFINGINLYNNFESIKKMIGYVPQSDIVYDNLTLYDMLLYTAKLRLPKDISAQEREAAIDRAIKLVELTDKKKSFIKRLSGGQKKRASIAVELLSDPNLLFLDEPASGLDPGTERSLMQSLREMADNGKTVILVTHSTLQLKLCDKIAFMGKGGNLCFYGSYDDALKFFGADDIIDVYNMITENSVEWKSRYNAINGKKASTRTSGRNSSASFTPRLQIPTLCARYLKLIINDKTKTVLLVLQAPVLAVLIFLVSHGDQYSQYETTKGLLFSLSCSAFWIGMLNAIQEICKERNILKRESMTGLSLTAYLMSKIIVLSVLCLIQCVLLILAFSVLVGLPDKGVMMNPFMELLITTFLTASSATAMGLLVSSLFTNPDRATTVAPFMLMPQILFSGLIFDLSGATEIISWFAVCRWSMEGYGTTADLNQIPLALQQEGVMLPHEAEDFFTYTSGHIIKAWIILAAFIVAFMILSRIVLNRIKKENA